MAVSSAAPGAPDQAGVVELRHHRRRKRGAPVVKVAPVPAVEDQTPELRLALTVQALYERRGLSLADPDAAAANEASFEAALLFLQGTHAQGLIDQAGFEALEGLMTAAQTAPQELTGE